MSAVTSRPRVRSVECSGSVIQSTGAVTAESVVASALQDLGRSLSLSAPTVVSAGLGRLVAGPETAARLVELRDEASARVAASANPVAAEKAAALLAISQAPMAVRLGAVAAHLQRLTEARSVGAVRKAERALIQAITIENAVVMNDVLVATCREASIAAGFTRVETMVGALGQQRIVATDETGRALVTEIRSGSDTHSPSIETEVVGYTDGRCQPILDRFDASMKAQGVHSDEPPERRFTGGVCELAYAREFIRKKVAPAARQSGSSTPVRNQRRRQAAVLRQRG